MGWRERRVPRVHLDVVGDRIQRAQELAGRLVGLKPHDHVLLLLLGVGVVHAHHVRQRGRQRALAQARARVEPDGGDVVRPDAKLRPFVPRLPRDGERRVGLGVRRGRPPHDGPPRAERLPLGAALDRADRPRVHEPARGVHDLGLQVAISWLRRQARPVVDVRAHLVEGAVVARSRARCHPRAKHLVGADLVLVLPPDAHQRALGLRLLGPRDASGDILAHRDRLLDGVDFHDAIHALLRRIDGDGRDARRLAVVGEHPRRLAGERVVALVPRHDR